MVEFPQSILPQGVDRDDFTPTPTGIPLTSADTGVDGIHAVIVRGECFGTQISWNREVEVTAIVSKDDSTGLPVLTIWHLGSEVAHPYLGLEADGVTWWRYDHEVDPTEYREHCLRVVRKA